MRSVLGRKLLVVLGVAVVGVVALAGPAAAHVTIDAGTTNKQGGTARAVFRVPNESETASTVKLEVTLPESQPLSSVRTMPVPGWKVETEKTKLATPLESHGRKITEAVTKITWTANTAEDGIKPGQYLEFPVSLGGLPKADQMVFKALQTYSDGTIVRWIEEKTGTEEPGKPAPVLKLVAADASPAPAAKKTETAASENKATLPLAITGAVAGLLGLGLGAAAFARSRRATS
ncbi:YcnI family protein [Longispora sp. NPDC051575]|uniref:YcnI family copper-binding membrane protein n=1 Tax=Longispora sp. NPDC051575 TaxID=3154943 RepID=UPI0034448FA6